MKALKTALLMIIALTSLSANAAEWNHLQVTPQIRLSYTQDYLPATYGASGGKVAGLFYVDVNTQSAAKVESVTIYKAQAAVLSFPLIKDTATHFYGKALRARTYADHVYFGQAYVIEVVIDGRLVRAGFKL